MNTQNSTQLDIFFKTTNLSFGVLTTAPNGVVHGCAHCV